jgi:hypothetical protein
VASLSYTLNFKIDPSLALFFSRPERIVGMASPKIILYQPNAAVRSQRIDTKEWDRRRPRLEELYVKMDKKLEEVMEIMALQEGFHAR